MEDGLTVCRHHEAWTESDKENVDQEGDLFRNVRINLKHVIVMIQDTLCSCTMACVRVRACRFCAQFFVCTTLLSWYIPIGG